MPLPNIKNIVWTAVQSAGVQWVTSLTDWMKRASITINGAKKTADFSDTMGTTGNWIKTGTGVTVDDGAVGKAHWNSVASTSTDRVHQAIGETLGDKFVVDWDFDPTSQSGNNHYGMISLCAGTSEPFASSQNAIICRYTINTISGSRDTAVQVKEGASSLVLVAQEDNNSALDGKLYYRLIRENDKLTYTTYYDSDRTEVVFTVSGTFTETITGLNTIIIGSTPNATGGSLTAELDNVSIYNNETVVENIPSQQTAVLDDDFNTDDWTQVGTAIVVDDTTDERVEFTNLPRNAEHKIHYNLSSVVNDSLWLLDFKVNISSSSTSGNGGIWIGLVDSSNELHTGSVDAITVNFFDNSIAGTDMRMRIAEYNAGTLSTSSNTTALSINTDYYVRLVRTSSTNVNMEIYSDSNRSVLVESISKTVNTSTGALDFIQITSQNAGDVGTVTGIVDDVQFWNNITEVNPSTLTDYPIPIKITGNTNLQRKTTETSEQLFDTDNFTDADSTNIGVNTTTERLEFDIKRDGSNDGSALDLGTALSDTEWRVDYDLHFTTLTESGNSQILHIGLSSGDETVDSATSQDAFTLRMDVWSGGQVTRFTDSEAQNLEGTTLYTFTDLVVDRDYYVSMIRYSATETRLIIYADKARTIILQDTDVVTTTSGVGELQYFKVTNGGGTTQTGAIIGYIDNLRIWDALTNPVNQETVTREDTFGSTTGWTPKDISECYIDTGNNRLYYNGDLDTTDSTIYYDVNGQLGYDLDSEKIVVRCEPKKIANNNLSHRIEFRLSDNISDIHTSSNSVGFILGADNSFRGFVNENSATRTDATVFSSVSNNVAEYLEIVIDYPTVYFRTYTDNTYTVISEEQTLTLSSVMPKFKYIKVGDRNTSSPTNSLEAEIKNLKIWNGITSPNASARKFVFTDDVTDDTATQYSSETISYDPINGDYYGYVRIPSLTTGANTTIQMYYDYTPSANPSYVPDDFTVDFSEDYTTDSGWTKVGTNVTINGTTTGKWNISGDSTDRVHRALGFTLDNQWVARGSIISNTYGTTGVSNIPVAFMDDNQNPKHGTGNNGIVLYQDTTGGTRYFWIGRVENGTLTRSASSATSFTTGTTYYWELSRINSTTARLRIYSDSSFSTLLGETTETIEAMTGLDTIIHAGDSSTASAVDVDGDDTQVWNGVINPNREQSTWDSNYKAVYHLQGNSIDSTVNGNDGTETATSFETQNNSVGLTANGTTTKIDVGSDASIDDSLVGGGVITFTINPKSDGELSNGVIITKRAGYMINLKSESGGFTKLRIIKDYNTTDGEWETTNAIIPINELTIGSMSFNEDSVNNNPILILNGIKHTVGNGLTETVTPVGSPVSDASASLIIGNETGSTQTFDGFIDEIYVSDKSRPSSHAITTYNAEKSDTDMVTVGTEESQ